MVSIIIAAYNAEKYLDSCLDSVLRQSYEDFEIVLVNDGSSDKTEEVAMKWAERDTRIRFFSQNNAGVSKTRNFAISQSRGEYLSFIDADDVVAQDFIQVMVNILEQENADCAIVGVAPFSGRRLPQKGKDMLIRYTGEEALNKLFLDFHGYMANKLYQRSIIKEHGIQLNDKISVMEDVLFNITYFQYSEKICFNPAIRYFYRQHCESACNNFQNIRWFSILDAYDLIYQKYSVDCPEMITYLYLRILYEASYRASKIEEISDLLHEEILRKIKLLELKKYQFSWKKRIKLFLFKYCPIPVMMYRYRKVYVNMKK